MISENKNPLMAMVMSRALANSEHLDDKQKSRAMIAAMVLGNPLLSMLLVRSMQPGKGLGNEAVVFTGKDGGKGSGQQASKS